MTISCNFPGGNIELAGIWEDRVWVRPELRDTAGDWFYWAFCVRGAAGKTLTFDFCHDRVGYFGPAVSRDLTAWAWAGSDTAAPDRKSFTYRFREEEDCVYFAHNMLYQPDRFTILADRLGIPVQKLADSPRGRAVPMVRFGEGNRAVVLTARHHCCESTGSYVLEGVVEYLFSHLPKNFCIVAVPFMDMDGVVCGDQGKNRIPHDHNRDYSEAPLYPEVRELMRYTAGLDVRYAFDFHSPWHLGERNDSVFLVRNLLNPDGQDKLSRLFAQASADLSFRYDGRDDIAPGEGWNVMRDVMCSNHFALRPDVELSMTLETAYFGREGNRAGQQEMVLLGHAFGEALCRMIKGGSER